MTSRETRAPRPNLVLRHIREVERHESRKEFAKAMADAAYQLRLNVAPDARYVAHLELGTIGAPRGPYRQVLERVTGRPFAELGWAVPAAPEPVAAEPSTEDEGTEYGDLQRTLSLASGLWRSDVERRDFLLGATFSSAAMLVPSMDFVVQPQDRSVESTGQRRVRMADVELIRDMCSHALEMDAKHGGGRVRASLVAFLDSEVTDLLRGSYNDEVGRALMAATAEATYLTGWMAFDTGRHAMAQRYYTQALRFAQAAGDKPLGSEIISYMSYLAQDAGSYADAVRLARAGVAADDRSSAAHSAHLHSFEAWALASAEDAYGAQAAIDRASEAFAAVPAEEPTTASGASMTAAGLTGLFAHCYVKLGMTAQGEQATGLALRQVEAPRDRAFCLIHAGNLAVQRREADAAVHHVLSALDNIEGIASTRLVAELHGFRDALGELGSGGVIAEFNDRLRAADLAA